MRRSAGSLPLALLAVVAPIASRAEPTPPRDGRAIMVEVDARRRTASESSEGVITVAEKGKVKEKAWRSWRSGWGAEAKGLIQFLAPSEVKGVGLLTLSHAGKPSEQWFYAPAIDRDRRIAQQEKSSRFLGTHFTYEDMEERQLDAYDYALEGEETLDGAPCYKVSATPRPSEQSQYSRLLFWVREDRYVTIQVHGFVDGALRRIFRGTDLRQVEGVWLVQRWVLSDTKREGTTTLVQRNVRLRIPVDAGLFSVAAMRTIHEPPR